MSRFGLDLFLFYFVDYIPMCLVVPFHLSFSIFPSLIGVCLSVLSCVCCVPVLLCLFLVPMCPLCSCFVLCGIWFVFSFRFLFSFPLGSSFTSFCLD